MKIKKVEAKRSPKNKYGIKFKGKTKIEKDEEKAKKENKERAILKVLEYEFTSCPVLTLNDNIGLTRMIDLVNFSADMHSFMLDGGAATCSNYYFECHRTIINEQKRIENEEMKESRAKSKLKTPTSKKKPKMGRR